MDKAIPFPDIDPYEILNLSKDATDQQIKRSYRKLMLVYHPDKLSLQPSQNPEAAKDQFHKIQFSYEILTKHRSIYDETTSIEACFNTNASLFDGWKDFFNSDLEITKELIEEDKKKYRNSEDEFNDILESWTRNCNDFPAIKKYIPDEDPFTLLFQEIPHLEPTKEDEIHIFERIKKLINDQFITDACSSFSRWSKNRKRFLYALQKRTESESKLAEEMLNEMELGSKPSHQSLQQIINAKNKRNWNSMIERLEAKTKNGKNKRVSKRAHEDLNDDEFAKIQKKLLKKKKLNK